MSNREGSELNYGTRSPSKTEKIDYESNSRDDYLKQMQTDRNLHQESPTKHDVEFYIRKVNRYEVEIHKLQNDLSLARFKLSKAEDFENKYDHLFKENQKTVEQYFDAKDQAQKNRRDVEKLRLDLDHAYSTIKNLKSQIENERRATQDLRNKKEELRNKTSNEGIEEREAIKQSFLKEIDNIKRQNKEVQDKLKREISELKANIANKEIFESAQAFKLQKIKKEKNDEIERLKKLTTQLKEDLSENNKKREEKLTSNRTDLITETQDRISNVRKLSKLIEESLTQEINNLNDTLTKKNNQIQFLIACDKKQLEKHEESENSLKLLIKRLEDKIFLIQRENEIELFSTIDRLKKQYDQNIESLNNDFDKVRQSHQEQVNSLKKQISDLKKQVDLLNSENKTLEAQHKQLAQDKEHSVQMLSQKIISMQNQKDNELRNYTTSMKQIEDDAKTKLDDLHTAIQNKNTEVQIMQAQLILKNSQINHLLEEISKLRDLNREKLKKLETTNAAQQNALNNEISAFKREVLELKRNIHEIQNQRADDEAAYELKLNMLKEDLQSQKEANELLKARNTFLTEWCQQLQRDLKAERVSNVNILHDQNISHRENVQLRQEVRVEIQAIKNKEVEQIKNIFKLEKNRLENELNKKQHDLREKKEELSRLLIQYKHLQSKIGKPSKLDRGSEEQGKCRATLQAQILLTENIFNAINRA